MTVPQILKRVGRVKPISRETLYVYFRRFKIKPIGARQCPQQFPENTPNKILLRLGYRSKHGRRNGR